MDFDGVTNLVSQNSLYYRGDTKIVLPATQIFLISDSAQRATLDTGGWLALTRQGLSPCKMHQASLDALTPAFAVGLERSGKPIRQDALVIRFFDVHSLTAPLQLIHFLES